MQVSSFLSAHINRFHNDFVFPAFFAADIHIYIATVCGEILKDRGWIFTNVYLPIFWQAKSPLLYIQSILKANFG